MGRRPRARGGARTSRSPTSWRRIGRIAAGVASGRRRCGHRSRDRRGSRAARRGRSATGRARRRLRPLERSATLSADDGTRGRRLLAAADAAWRAGQIERALTLLDRAGEASHPPDPTDVTTLRAVCALKRGDLASAFDESIIAARATLTTRPDAAAAVLECAAEASWWAGRVDWAAETRSLALDLRTADPPGCASRLGLLIGSAEIMQGRYAEAAASLRAAIVTSEPNGAPSMVPATAALFLGDDETALLGFQRVIRSLRERSEIGGLVHALSMAAGIDLWRGRFAQGVTSATRPRTRARDASGGRDQRHARAARVGRGAPARRRAVEHTPWRPSRSPPAMGWR